MVDGKPANFHPVKLGEPAQVVVEPDTHVLKPYDFHHGALAAVFQDRSSIPNSAYKAAQEQRCL